MHVDGDYAYLGDYVQRQLYIYDVSDKTSPTFVSLTFYKPPVLFIVTFMTVGMMTDMCTLPTEALVLPWLMSRIPRRQF